MTRISEMYRVSGGTDYTHLCSECINLRERKIGIGSRTSYKCRIYGITENTDTDWKRSYIACAWFNRTGMDREVIRLHERPKKEENVEIEGQMSVFDFLKE